ncbi:viral Gp157 protein [Brevirhabdus pacifica]|nr:siphovirus Gp157 family protein [Brevirhabdus pacifica]PJJ86814.1 viral Gp157 protein [Brevirhabdus pacifica]
MKDDRANELSREAVAAKDLIAALASDDERLNHDMVEGETSLFEAFDAALAEIDECQVIVEGCKAKEAVFAERRERSQRRIERLRGLIEQAIVVSQIEGAIRRPTATLSVSNLKPKPVVTDEASIPAKFWKPRDPVIDLKAIKDAIDNDETVPGVSMTNGSTSLTIRSK